MKKRIGGEGFRIIEAWLRREALSLRASQPLSATGLVQAACIDGTDLRAWSIRHPRDNRRGFSDPDAMVGRHGRGYDLGYKLHVSVDHRSILPLAARALPYCHSWAMSICEFCHYYIQ
jgi:hypothetical protein